MRLRGHLEYNEHLIVGVRSHPVTLIPAASLLLGAAVIASFASSLMPTAAFLAYVSLALALWLAVLVVLKILRWATTSYLLTNLRIVTQAGLFQTHQQSIPLDIVEAVDLKTSRMNIGQQANLVVRFMGKSHLLPGIPQARAFSQQIFKAQQATLRSRFSQ